MKTAVKIIMITIRIVLVINTVEEPAPTLPRDGCTVLFRDNPLCTCNGSFDYATRQWQHHTGCPAFEGGTRCNR